MADVNDIKGSRSDDKPNGKKLRIFTSFQQQEDEMIEYWASITPGQRLRHLYEMIKISFRLPDIDRVDPHPPRTVKIISRQ